MYAKKLPELVRQSVGVRYALVALKVIPNYQYNVC